MSPQFLAASASAQPDGRGPAQLHPRWAYSGRMVDTRKRRARVRREALALRVQQ